MDRIQVKANGAASVLVAVCAIFTWLVIIAGWTVGHGKAPGSALPDWVTMASMGTGFLAAMLSAAMLLQSIIDQKEQLSGWGLFAVALGLSPFAYFLVLWAAVFSF